MSVLDSGCWQGRGLSSAAIVSLGLAIGASAAAFSLVNALILRKLPMRPDTLVSWMGWANQMVRRRRR